MALILAGLDEWTPLGNGHEIFIRADALTDPDYRVRLEVAGGPCEVRCLAPLPAGFWLRPAKGGPLFVPSPYDTAQFRRDDLDLEEKR